MMRIAIAGGGGFAFILAHAISQTPNALIILSRSDHPEFARLDCQVAKVDFDDQNGLRYTLQGVDLLISTISGTEQLNLIDAARRARVRLFVPSEFEGGLRHRPHNDPLDRGSAAALEQLRHWAESKQYNMQWTVFSCGIFYERFAPGGLANYGIGEGSGVANQGDYLVDVGNATGDVVEVNAQGQPVRICMTSVADVARFVAAAIEMGPANWPREFKMRGDRMAVRDVVRLCSQVRGTNFRIQNRRYNELGAHLDFYRQQEDWGHWYYVQRLQATADGRYDFSSANLNDDVEQSDHVDVQPVRFGAWLENQWSSAT